MNNFIMLVGLPGSGKSTYAKETLAKKYKDNKWFGELKVYSSDGYRKELFGDERDQTHNKEVFEALYKDIEEEADKYNTVVLDATNICSKNRAKAIEVANKAFKKNQNPPYIIAYVFHTPLEECIRRDSLRERKVEEKTIRRMASMFESPAAWEGIDRIIHIDEETQNTPYYLKIYAQFLLDPLYSKMVGFNQNNPHHKLTLDQHCLKVARLAYENGEDHATQIAGLLHDLGKLDTQTIDDKGISHYYNHENYSVLRAFNLLKNVEELNNSEIEIIMFLIQNHMKVRSIKQSPKSTSKHISKWGENLFNLLVRFSEYDEEANC